ncbi:unnamed protein product, partial [Didymodactylos carnosus]
SFPYYSIQEKLPIATLVVDLSKTQNLSLSAEYSYFDLTQIGTKLFLLDKSRILTSVILDRDQMCLKQQCSCLSCQISLEIIIKLPSHTIYETMQIRIIDLNDHTPTFTQNNQTIEIKENVPLGYRVVLPIATDEDEGVNSVQSYDLNGFDSSDFELDYSSLDALYLVVKRPLDREKISSYNLKLTASDYGKPSRSGFTQLNIHILDVNDNVAQFKQPVYNVDVKEDLPIHSILLKVEATDLDIGENGLVHYQLLNSEQLPFTINSSTGEISLRSPLDYETVRLYRLTVKAQDSGQDSMPTYATVLVNVLDCNDNPPQITIKVEGNTTLRQSKNPLRTTLFVQEDVSLGTTLAHVILSDNDSFVNGNPYLQLTSVSLPIPFVHKLLYVNDVKNTKLYALVLQYPLDREIKSLYDNIELIAHDSGTPSLSTRLQLTLNITDVNDCIPTFEKKIYEFNVDENNPKGFHVGTLIARDCDLGMNAEFEYHLVNETDDLLRINSTTGELFIMKTIDYELFNSTKKISTIYNMEFNVKVIDHGQPPLSSEVRVLLRIHDLNDNEPIFKSLNNYNWTIKSSNLKPYDVIGQVQATDADCGLQGLVRYGIEPLSSKEECLVLGITKSGFVYIVSSSCIFDHQRLFRYQVHAHDLGTPISKSAIQILNIVVNQNLTPKHSYPQLVSDMALLSRQEKVFVSTVTDLAQVFVNNVLFIVNVDIMNYSLPEIRVQNASSSYWTITLDGQVSIVGLPVSSSTTFDILVIDIFNSSYWTQISIQIELCNSSIARSCEYAQQRLVRNFQSLDSTAVIRDQSHLLSWAIGLALLMTFVFIGIFSMITCLCCRKHQKQQHHATHQQNQFLQCNDDSNSEKTESSSDQFKTSSVSTTLPDMSGDSIQIINRQTSSLSSSSPSQWAYSLVRQAKPSQTDSRYCRESTVQLYNEQKPSYFYDIKLAELLKKQNPQCLHLRSPPVPPLSVSLTTSTDYGCFGSSDLSSEDTSIENRHQISQDSFPFSLNSDWGIEMTIDNLNSSKNQFISTKECVV